MHVYMREPRSYMCPMTQMYAMPVHHDTLYVPRLTGNGAGVSVTPRGRAIIRVTCFLHKCHDLVYVSVCVS